MVQSTTDQTQKSPHPGRVAEDRPIETEQRCRKSILLFGCRALADRRARSVFAPNAFGAFFGIERGALDPLVRDYGIFLVPTRLPR
jgi:hypothetical protein